VLIEEGFVEENGFDSVAGGRVVKLKRYRNILLRRKKKERK